MMRCIRGWRAYHGKSTSLQEILLILSLLLAGNVPAQAQGNESSLAQSPALTAAQRERLKERDQLDRLVRLAQGFPQIAVLIAKAWPFDTQDISSLADNDLIEKMIFGAAGQKKTFCV